MATNLRSPLRFDPENPPCDDGECHLPSSIANAIMDERMRNPSGPWRAALAEAKATYRRQKQQTNDRGATKMATTTDAHERERLARAKLISDRANAYRPTDHNGCGCSRANGGSADDEQPSTNTDGMTREQRAKEANRIASANAYKTGGQS